MTFLTLETRSVHFIGLKINGIEERSLPMKLNNLDLRANPANCKLKAP